MTAKTVTVEQPDSAKFNIKDCGEEGLEIQQGFRIVYVDRPSIPALVAALMPEGVSPITHLQATDEFKNDPVKMAALTKMAQRVAAIHDMSAEVDEFLRCHPEYRCLDVIGKFAKWKGQNPAPASQWVSEKESHTMYCQRCDGVGTYEGGTAIKTRCQSCGGLGVVMCKNGKFLPPAPSETR